MNVQEQIDRYFAGQPDAKRRDMEELHRLVLRVRPGAGLWYLDGTNEDGKVVSNPNIGYGSYRIRYADGTTRDFYRIGLSANKTGISVYILGFADKAFLSATYGARIGKASVTGYCIRFRALRDIDAAILEEAIRYRFDNPDA